MPPPATLPSEEQTETIILSPPPERDNLAETVILSRSSLPPADASQGRPPEEEETLILPSGSRKNVPGPKAPSPDEELIQETIILSPGNIAKTMPRDESINPETGRDDLPETIVLSPGGRSKGRSDSATPKHPGDDRTKARPQTHRKNGAERKEDASQEDDILTETIILRPQKNKGARDE